MKAEYRVYECPKCSKPVHIIFKLHGNRYRLITKRKKFCKHVSIPYVEKFL